MNKPLTGKEKDALRYVLGQAEQCIERQDDQTAENNPEYEYHADYENFIVGMSKAEYEAFKSGMEKIKLLW